MAKTIAQSREVPEIPKIVLTKDIEHISEDQLKKIAENVVQKTVDLIIQ